MNTLPQNTSVVESDEENMTFDKEMPKERHISSEKRQNDLRLLLL